MLVCWIREEFFFRFFCGGKGWVDENISERFDVGREGSV